MVACPVLGLVLFGTSSTLLCKTLLSMQVTIAGTSYTFAKPAFVTFLVCFANLSTVFIGVRYGLSWSVITRGAVLKCAGLAIVDVLAVTIMQSGLVFITPSASLMLRMASIAFAALFRWIAFRSELSRRQLLGVLVLVLALAVVVWSVSMQHMGPYAVLGCGLTVLAQLFRGALLVAEEMTMKSLPALGVSAGEGLWGVTLMSTVVLPAMSAIPGSDHGALEWLPGTLDLLEHSSLLVCLAGTYVMSVCLESACGMMVTDILSSVHRSFLQFGVRIMTVWCADLLLFWASAGRLGEPWTPASGVQGIGFSLLLVSLLLYFKGAPARAPKTQSEPLLSNEDDSR
mmetsp:Transcript_59797/g.192461  ORF Transcript_59797/g.192461 Transcript_59797/m.192461 type:complete len:343 (-) Transcript_59797:97-1125(-)